MPSGFISMSSGATGDINMVDCSAEKGVLERPWKERVQSVPSGEEGSRMGWGSSRERSGSESFEGESSWCTCCALAEAWTGGGEEVGGLGWLLADGGGVACWYRWGMDEKGRVGAIARRWKYCSAMRQRLGFEMREATNLAPARRDAVPDILWWCWNYGRETCCFQSRTSRRTGGPCVGRGISLCLLRQSHATAPTRERYVQFGIRVR